MNDCLPRARGSSHVIQGDESVPAFSYSDFEFLEVATRGVDRI